MVGLNDLKGLSNLNNSINIPSSCGYGKITQLQIMYLLKCHDAYILK